MTILLVSICYNASAFGLADWQIETPGGNFMFDAGEGTNLTFSKNGEDFDGIKA